MGIRIRLGMRGGNGFSALKTLTVAMKRIASIRLPDMKESVSVGMFTSEYLPYEASETYRKIMIEFNNTRSETLVETQRQLMRGI